MASGYYEWEHTENGKLPYRIEHPEGSPMIFAGLWTYNSHLDLHSYSIVTTAKAPSIEWLHKRPAAVLMPDQIDLWLNGPWNKAKSLAVPFMEDLKTIAVSADVGKVGNNHAELLDPI